MVDTGYNIYIYIALLPAAYFVEQNREDMLIYNVEVFLCRHANTRQFLNNLHDGVGSLGLTYLTVDVCDVLKFAYRWTCNRIWERCWSGT